MRSVAFLCLPMCHIVCHGATGKNQGFPRVQTRSAAHSQRLTTVPCHMVGTWITPYVLLLFRSRSRSVMMENIASRSRKDKTLVFRTAHSQAAIWRGPSLHVGQMPMQRTHPYCLGRHHFQNPGVRRTRTVRISRRPRSIATHKSSFAESGSTA